MPHDAPSSWFSHLVGKFIVFDGPDGSGKSTQLKLFAEAAAEAKLHVCEVREPGGTGVGEQIRKVLLDKTHEDMDLRCEMLLYMASRAQLVTQRIRPALAAGQLVLADRFISSTLAYQGAAAGLPESDILAAAKIAAGECMPDLVVIFDVSDEVATQRLLGSGKAKNKIEVGQPSLFSDRMEMKGLDYWKKVRQGYLDQAQKNPRNYLVIDAAPPAEVVFKGMLQQLKNHFR